MRFAKLINPFSAEGPGRALYVRIVAQARQPEFYRHCGVPDTLDGRFEMLALHMFLVLRRLKDEDAAALSQELLDTLFADMDENLREMGVGDLSVGRRVKQMADAFYGRIAAYEDGLSGEAGVLEASLARNLFGTVDASPAALRALAAYLRREARSLAALDVKAVRAGEIAFDPPPKAAEGQKG